MKPTRITANLIMAGIALFLAAGQIGAGAQTITPPPSLINFQGRLAKPDGTPVTDGTNYAVTLSLWDAASGGAMRWQQTFSNVTVRNGVFAVLLNLNSGFTSGNTLDTTINNSTYLQVQVGTNPALTPRQQLVSNAYALKAATVADNSISITKLTTDLKNSILGGPAGGDLVGNYPSPQLKTDVSLLNKVSGTLLAVASATTAVDQSQPLTTATVTSSAWQSFTPSTTGTLLEIDIQTGTTGAQIPATLSLYLGQGTTSNPLQTIPITINSALGLQSFPITANVTAGQVYTFAIGSNNNLIFGYTGGTPYAGGRADLGPQFDYQFQTRMKLTSSPATVINANASLSLNGTYYLAEAATPGPMLVKQYNPFTSGANTGIGRSGLYQPDATTLFLGVPGTDIAGTSLRFGTWSGTGTRTDLLTILNGGNVGIGTTAPAYPLDVAGNIRVSGSNNGVIFPDGSKQLSAAIVSGSAAGGDLTGIYPNPTLATKATSLAKVSGGAMTSNGTQIGIGTSSPIQTLDINGGLNVINGVIQRGGSAITSATTTDLGLYSETSGNWVRFVNNAGYFKWFSDSGAGTNSIMALDSTGSLSVGGNVSAGGGISAALSITTPSFMNASAFAASDYITAAHSIQVGGGSGNSTSTITATSNTALNVFNQSSSSPALYVQNYANGGRAATFVGSITATSKNFTIDDPIDPENKYLVHGCVESDERRNIYDGTVTLDSKGEATIQMPKWFEALNRDCRYQLTCIGGYAQVYIAEKMNANHFKIAGGKPGLEISWQVTGVRQDAWAKANPMAVEEDKGVDRGKYLTPEAFGLPASRGGAMQPPMPKPDVKKADASKK